MTLQVQDLRKEYPTRGEPLKVLNGVSFEVSPGQSIAVLGPSGCGKSTMLQVLGTLQRPTSGTLSLDGIDPFGLSEAKLAGFRNEQIGFIFQDHHLLPQLTALENILIPVVAKGATDDKHIARAKQLLERVGLADRTDHRPAELSGGERQRIATARALINQPKLLLADEPTGNLDRKNAELIADMLLEVQTVDEAKPVMLVVTHNRELAQRFDQQWELEEGRIK